MIHSLWVQITDIEYLIFCTGALHKRSENLDKYICGRAVMPCSESVCRCLRCSLAALMITSIYQLLCDLGFSFFPFQNHTGSSLYILYKATEMLTDYGPVDAVTGEAHYTLSEERLLKETIHNEPLVCSSWLFGSCHFLSIKSCSKKSNNM